MESFGVPGSSQEASDAVVTDRLVSSSGWMHVYEGHIRNSLVWVHRIRLRTESQPARAAAELRKLQLPPNEFLVRILDVQPKLDVFGYFLYVSLERSAGEQTLQEALDQLGVCNFCLKTVTVKVLKGLIYLHNSGISHANLKPSSIVWGQRRFGSLERTVKLTDPDYTWILNSTIDGNQFHQANFAPNGSLKYMTQQAAKAVIDGSEMSWQDARSSDIHALGCVVLQMSAKGFAFSDGRGSSFDTIEQADTKESSPFWLQQLAKGYRPVISTRLSCRLQAFLSACFRPGITTDQLLTDRFFSEFETRCQGAIALANSPCEKFLQQFHSEIPTCNQIALLNHSNNVYASLEVWKTDGHTVTFLMLDASGLETGCPEGLLSDVVQQDHDLPTVFVTGRTVLLDRRTLSFIEDVLVTLVLKSVKAFSTVQLQAVNLPHLTTIMFFSSCAICLVGDGFKQLSNLRALIFRQTTAASVHLQAFRSSRPLELISVDSCMELPAALSSKAIRLRRRPPLYVWMEELIREPLVQEIPNGVDCLPYEIVDMVLEVAAKTEPKSAEEKCRISSENQLLLVKSRAKQKQQQLSVPPLSGKRSTPFMMTEPPKRLWRYTPDPSIDLPWKRFESVATSSAESPADTDAVQLLSATSSTTSRPLTRSFAARGVLDVPVQDTSSCEF